MSQPADEQQDNSPTGGVRYSFGYGSATTMMGSRSVAQYATFIPHLKPGMTVLDCGCGPGTITLGLAELDRTINITGMDFSEDQINRARGSATEKGIGNVRFEVGSVYELPFPDNSFDAVFSNALYVHLTHPADAIRESHRVLKDGGILGIRQGVHNLDLIHPPEPKLKRWFEVYAAVLRANGGDPDVGGRLGAMLRESGFSDVIMAASLNCHSSGPSAQGLSEQMAGLPVLGQAVESGIITEEKSQEINAAWLQWGTYQDAFLARPWGEAMGWKT
jgi:SAM-dependent methyltransferase